MTPTPSLVFCALVGLCFGLSTAPLPADGTPSAPCVVINEVHYDAEPKTERTEFVELHNAGATAADLSVWRLEGVGDYVFPPGTMLGAGGYLVIAEDPATLLSKLGVATSHQYPGSLSNAGDDLRLFDAVGAEIDRVSYQAGFPWPTGARGTGASMELIHPALDNDLGGSWRSSLPPAPLSELVLLPASASGWRWRPGTSEASSPVDAWRGTGFAEDGTWSPATLPIGFGAVTGMTFGTAVDGMRNTYPVLFLRNEFVIAPGEIPPALRLRFMLDDGIAVWINGVEVHRENLPVGALSISDTAGGNYTEGLWVEKTLGGTGYLVEGSNTICVQLFNAAVGSSDLGLDLELIRPASGLGLPPQPTPGAPNSVFAPTAPPQIRQVAHFPEQPTSGVPVTVTAKATDPDGVASLTLSYQTLSPGSYVRRSDAAYETNWTNVPMRDDGTGGDAVAGDTVFTATLPAGLQVHRRLVRYRIAAQDTLGSSVRVPYPDDECPNFAYFVYDGVPAWSGADRPGVTAVQTVPAAVMAQSLPIYHLIANGTDVTNSQYSSSYDGVRMWGTMVYDGKVYDHIQFYNRGEASSYRSGKNKWRFKFNRARDFAARDIYGKRYRTDWKTLNFNACASPWMPVNRGMAGFDEAVPHRLYQLAGVPSSNTHWVQFRVVDGAAEAPADQYAGDLWGLYLAIEHPDGRFLDERGLPDGSTYKIQGNNGNKKNQGPTQPLDSSDWTAFWNASGSLNTVSWWRENCNLDVFYGFRAINRATGNVDLRDGTNYYMYHHPDGRWHVIPWDLDMMYIPETHWSGVIRADACLGQSTISIEFKNRCRELLDLLFSDIDRHGGQAAQVVEELAQIVNPPGVPLTMVDVDQFMWNYNSRTAADHLGQWYVTPKTQANRGGTWTRTLPTPDHEGFQQNMIDYMYDTDPDGFAVGDGDERGYGFNYLSLEASDSQIPNRPTVAYSGEAGFPTDGLRFTSSTFADPNGSGTFASVEWRIGRVSNPATPDYVAGEPWVYEIEPVWNSGPMAPFAAQFSPPAAIARPGETYRVRVRHWDNTGRASRWSAPVEFVASEPDVTNYRDRLVISEIMYHPAGAPTAEFVELHNIGSTPLDLTGVRFTKGIDFDFPDGTVIAAGAYLVVVKDLAVFEAQYGTGLPIAGVWEIGDSLSNGGENVKLSLGAGTAIHEFAYADALPWPTAADGGGYSLTLAGAKSGIDHADPTNWRASAALGGSPGTGDGVLLTDWLGTHGLTAADELTDSDGDGLRTLVEYGVGRHPGVADAASVLLTGSDAAGGWLAFRRARAADDVRVTAEFSADLGTWLPAAPAAVDSGSDGTDTVTVRPPIALPGSAPGFFRLRVERR